MKEPMIVTEDNFHEYEMKVCRLEHRVKERKAAVIAGCIANGVAPLLCIFAFPILGENAFFLCLLPCLFSLPVYFLTALIARMTYSAPLSTPPQGNAMPYQLER